MQRALKEPDYLPWLRGILDRHNLKCLALATHLVGQAVCDNVDAREVMDTARAAARFGVHQINGLSNLIWY